MNQDLLALTHTADEYDKYLNGCSTGFYELTTCL